MKSNPEKTAVHEERADSSPGEDRSTGLPGFRSWNQVYAFVAAVFVLYVVMLTALARCFS